MDSDTRESLAVIQEALATILQRLDRMEVRLALLEPKRFTCPNCGGERISSGRLGERCPYCGHIPGRSVRGEQRLSLDEAKEMAMKALTDAEEARTRFAEEEAHACEMD